MGARSKRSDIWDPLKYISLGVEGRYLTLSSDIRHRVEGFHLRGDSTAPSTIDNYLLQRYLVGADLHLGPRFRLFTEFQSGIIKGLLRSPRPTDLKLLLHAAVGQGKYVGTNPGVVGVWQATRHIMLEEAITRFIAGAFLEEAIAAGGLGFYSATLLYCF